VTSPLFPPPRKRPFDILDVSQPINTPFRVKRALDGAQAAAFVLAGYNLLTGLIIWSRDRRVPTWLGDDPQRLWAIHVIAALVATSLALLIRRRSPDWAVWLVFGWAILELIRIPTARLYGHGMPWLLGGLTLLFAIQGVRGVLGRRRLARAEESPANGT
jgi:hypothetical protein